MKPKNSGVYKNQSPYVSTADDDEAKIKMTRSM